MHEIGSYIHTYSCNDSHDISKSLASFAVALALKHFMIMAPAFLSYMLPIYKDLSGLVSCAVQHLIYLSQGDQT